jgi:hypothetical protein
MSASMNMHQKHLLTDKALLTDNAHTKVLLSALLVSCPDRQSTKAKYNGKDHLEGLRALDFGSGEVANQLPGGVVEAAPIVNALARLAGGGRRVMAGVLLPAPHLKVFDA